MTHAVDVASCFSESWNVNLNKTRFINNSLSYEVVKPHAGPFADITVVLGIIAAWAIVVFVSTADMINTMRKIMKCARPCLVLVAYAADHNLSFSDYPQVR